MGTPLLRTLWKWVHHYYVLYGNGYTIITCFMEMGTIITCFMEMGTPLLRALCKWVHHYNMLYGNGYTIITCFMEMGTILHALWKWVHHYYVLYGNGYTIITCFMEMGTPLLCALWKWVHHYYMLYKKEEKKKKSGFSYDLLSLGLVVNQNHGQWSSCDSDLETFFYNRKLSDILLDTWWDDISSLTAEGSVIQKIQTAQSCSEDDNPCLTLVFVSGKQQ